MANTKQVIVIRRDLKMRRGKEIAQGAHAATISLWGKLLLGEKVTDDERLWLENDYPKVVCQARSLDEIQDVADRATAKGLDVSYQWDKGFTEFHGKQTLTCIAIGPHDSDRFVGVTDHLELY